MWFVSNKKYKKLLEEKEDFQNLYNNLKIRFISLDEKYCALKLAQGEENKKIRGEVYLLNENEKLTEWIRDILKVFGEEQPDNCTVPIKIPYFKHNKEFNNVVSCGFLPKEGKAGYIPTEEIIIPELHIIVRGI